MILEFDLLSLKCRKDEDLDKIYLLAKEGWSKSALEEFETASASAKSFHGGRHVNEQFYLSPCLTTAQKYCHAMPKRG